VSVVSSASTASLVNADGARLRGGFSPAGFERYFEELIDLFADGRPKPELIGAVAARYGLEVDPASIPILTAEHGVVFE
jgi:hypothetical protein